MEPHYPKAGRGRKTYELSTMLRIHFMQQWFGYSDAAMKEAQSRILCMKAHIGWIIKVLCTHNDWRYCQSF
ncbi:transposase [Nitrosomonas sp. Nm166]|uniref:transposase n=1 Tax=Nitrosomonas sp. Nm166 TaxID=1881054 RepID=UPI00352339A1